MKNKIIIAGAGSGKTTTLINKSIIDTNKTLITTYTTDNENGIKDAFYKKLGYIPAHVEIQTWLSLLYEHGVKPFYGSYIPDEDFLPTGVQFVNDRSVPYIGEGNLKHYFNKKMQIYSDKIAKFVFNINKINNGRILERLTKVYKNFYIDEIQDFAGYDLDLLKLLIESESKVLMVGDSRQTTYSTHYPINNKKYADGRILDYLNDKCSPEDVFVDTKSLKNSHRCCQEICDLANMIFPNSPQMNTNREDYYKDQGVYFVNHQRVDDFLEKYNPVQIRWSKLKQVNENYNVTTFGKSKGLTFDNILIYPTQKMKEWFKGKDDLSFSTRCKFYVGITRAKYRVGIVWDNKRIPTLGKEFK